MRRELISETYYEPLPLHVRLYAARVNPKLFTSPADSEVPEQRNARHTASESLEMRESIAIQEHAAWIDHPSEDLLEEFCLERFPSNTAQAIEKHIGRCARCLYRCPDRARFIACFRQAMTR